MTLTTGQWFVVAGYSLITIGVCTVIGCWIYNKVDGLNREIERLTRANTKMREYIAKMDKDGWERPPVKRRRNNLDQTREIHVKKNDQAGLDHWDG